MNINLIHGLDSDNIKFLPDEIDGKRKKLTEKMDLLKRTSKKMENLHAIYG